MNIRSIRNPSHPTSEERLAAEKVLKACADKPIRRITNAVNIVEARSVWRPHFEALRSAPVAVEEKVSNRKRFVEPLRVLIPKLLASRPGMTGPEMRDHFRDAGILMSKAYLCGSIQSLERDGIIVATACRDANNRRINRWAMR